MAYKPKKLKQKPQKLTREEQIKWNTRALAQLIYDIYQIKNERKRIMTYHQISDEHLKQFKANCVKEGIKYETEAV